MKVTVAFQSGLPKKTHRLHENRDPGTVFTLPHFAAAFPAAANSNSLLLGQERSSVGPTTVEPLAVFPGSVRITCELENTVFGRDRGPCPLGSENGLGK